MASSLEKPNIAAPLNLKLAIILAVLGLILSAGYSLLEKFPAMNQDERVSLVVTYLIIAGFGYYLFQFMLQGNLVAKKTLIVLCLFIMFAATVGLLVNFGFNQHLAIAIMVNVFGVSLISLVRSSSVSAWFTRFPKN